MPNVGRLVVERLPYSPFHKARDGAGLTRRDEEMDML